VAARHAWRRAGHTPLVAGGASIAHPPARQDDRAAAALSSPSPRLALRLALPKLSGSDMVGARATPDLTFRKRRCARGMEPA
jgi:hypothetical protein